MKNVDWIRDSTSGFWQGVGFTLGSALLAAVLALLAWVGGQLLQFPKFWLWVAIVAFGSFGLIAGFCVWRKYRKRLRYGSEIQLKHSRLGLFLKSNGQKYVHPLEYTSGAQQMVTVFMPKGEDSIWIVERKDGALGGNDVVDLREPIRLLHKQTMHRLHSHPYPSPITNNKHYRATADSDHNEVTAHDRPDINSRWRVVMLDGGRWEFGKSAYLIHVNTGATLHSHGNAEHHLTRGEFEVTGYKDKPGDYDEWIAVRPLKRFVLMDANPFKRLRSFFSRTSP